MRSFDATRWSPDGQRPHLHIAPGTAVAELAAAYHTELLRWWGQQGDGRALPSVVEVLDPSVLHLTVAWVDRRTRDIGETSLAAPHQAVAAGVAAIEPFPIRVGPAWVGTHAIELYVTPQPQLDSLAAAVRATIRDVLGAAAATEPPTRRPWRPHITLA